MVPAGRDDEGRAAQAARVPLVRARRGCSRSQHVSCPLHPSDGACCMRRCLVRQCWVCGREQKALQDGCSLSCMCRATLVGQRIIFIGGMGARVWSCKEVRPVMPMCSGGVCRAACQSGHDHPQAAPAIQQQNVPVPGQVYSLQVSDWKWTEHTHQACYHPHAPHSVASRLCAALWTVSCALDIDVGAPPNEEKPLWPAVKNEGNASTAFGTPPGLGLKNGGVRGLPAAATVSPPRVVDPLQAQVEGDVPQPRSGHSAAALADGRHVLLFGGGDAGRDSFFSTAALLDTHAWRWSTPKFQARAPVQARAVPRSCSAPSQP